MATGALIAGTALTVGGQVFSGLQQRKAAKKQTRLLRQQAQLEKEAAAFDAAQEARRFEDLLGQQRARISASGIRLEGSPLDILEETLRDKEETIQNILTTGQARVGALTGQAKEVQRQGRNALIGSIFGAIGTGLKGASAIKGGKIG